MRTKNVNIWIWLQNDKLTKAIINETDGTIRIFDENEKLILKRTGLNKQQVKKIELTIIKYGAKKLCKNAESFKFL
jgi:hypothetical protein